MTDKLYSSGEFAKKARVTIRTIRYYDKENILKPSVRTDNGNRMYSERDLVKLQQILLLKYLGFTLKDIREMTMGTTTEQSLLDSLTIQRKLITERIEEMKAVQNAIEETITAIQEQKQIAWDEMLKLIHMTSMEQSLKNQYVNSANINSRIRLHEEYSVNKQGWFPWIFEQCEFQKGETVLEVGCGNGALWCENYAKIPKDIDINLTDISAGMLRDARRNMEQQENKTSAVGANTKTLKDGQIPKFKYKTANIEKLPFKDETFDVVIANHVLFYCDNVNQAITEVRRVLKPGGRLIASTYGKRHMIEITELVQKFNSEISLSGITLYDVFGLHNGDKLLEKLFERVEKRIYEDEIIIDEAMPLIDYILSCHGNQNQLLVDHFKDFKAFVEQQVKTGFHITKDAGVFIATKQS